MPLRALIDGRDLLGPVMADSEWETLRADVRAKRATLSLPCCDVSAFPRVSKLGTRHFVHRRSGGCPGSGETFQHLWLKAEILAACAAAGWQAQPEAASDGWRADVLASRGGAHAAFEVQWSRQDAEISRFRHDRYAADGIRAYWLYRGEALAPATRELPIFQLQPDEEQVAVVEHAGQRYGVRKFVGLVLGGKVRFSARLTARLRVSFIEMDCWKCHKPAHIFYAQQWSRCGHELAYEFSREREDTLDRFEPQVLALVRTWLAGAGRAAGIRLGAIKERYSRTMESSYLSFGCPHCDALFGDWFVREVVMEAVLYDQAVASFEAELPAFGLEARQGHWCLPADGFAYCDAQAGEQQAA